MPRCRPRSTLSGVKILRSWWCRGRAKRLARSPRAVIVDTETTDLDGQICEIAIIDALNSRSLLNTLVRPSADICPEAAAVHGITGEMCASAPTMTELAPIVRRILHGAVVLAWNAPFDRRLIEAELSRAGHPVPRCRWVCLMRLDATIRGDRWRGLHGGHRAHGDVVAARQELLAMAGGTR